MGLRIMDQVSTLKDAEAVRAEYDAKHLEARRAYELANMSPDIKPEHYELCITQTLVAIVPADDGTYLVDVPEAEADTKPVGAVRVAYDTATLTKQPLTDQPPEKEAAIEPIDGEVTRR